jgi:hypothetical protein
VDNFFGDLKGEYVFNYLDDLVVYSASISEYQGHLTEVLDRLRAAGFTLNNEIVLGASEIKYRGHYLSSRGIRAIPDMVEPIRQFTRPRNLRSSWRCLWMVSVYARFTPEFLL